MGFTFRKSIKIGKNTRINLSSKGGVGFSTGVKGARVSVNRQGAKIYGGKGALRYQKQIYSNNNKESKSNNTTYQYEGNIAVKEPDFEGNIAVKKPNFFKRFYKEIIVVFIRILIGSLIGGMGKVSTSIVDETNMKIEENTKNIEIKEAKLEVLQNKKTELEASLKN